MEKCRQEITFNARIQGGRMSEMTDVAIVSPLEECRRQLAERQCPCGPVHSVLLETVAFYVCQTQDVPIDEDDKKYWDIRHYIYAFPKSGSNDLAFWVSVSSRENESPRQQLFRHINAYLKLAKLVLGRGFSDDAFALQEASLELSKKADQL
jgi:hypothetical protein